MRKITVLVVALLLGAAVAHADIAVPEAPPRSAGPDIGLQSEVERPAWVIPTAVAAGVVLVGGLAAVGLRRRRE